MYTIGKVSKLFGLSRSTLLYYDQIGLFCPSSRSRSNYRLYTEKDVQRMNKIQMYRDLGLSLEAIDGLLRDESSSMSKVLERHLLTLNQEIAKLRQQQRVIAKLLGGIAHDSRSMTKDRWVKLFAATGMSDADMCAWHEEFERNHPEAHQDFLESLGLEAKEIAEIRDFASKKTHHEQASHSRKL